MFLQKKVGKDQKASYHANMEISTSPGDWLKSRREQAGWSQKTLANLLGYSRSFIGQCETDESKVPAKAVPKLAELFGLSLEEVWSATRPGELFAPLLELPPDLPAELNTKAGVAARKYIERLREKLGAEAKRIIAVEKLKEMMLEVFGNLKMDNTDAIEMEEAVSAFIRRLPVDFIEFNPAAVLPIYDSGAGEPSFWESYLPAGHTDRYETALSNVHNPHAFYILISDDSMAPTVEPGDLCLVEPGIETVNGKLCYVNLATGSANSYDNIVKRYRGLPDGTILLESDNRHYEPIVLAPESDYEANIFRVTTVVKVDP